MSEMQKAVMEEANKSDVVYSLISRQQGKSTVNSSIFFDKTLKTVKPGQTVVTLSPMEGDIKNKLIEDILLEPFGGANSVYDINAIYVKPVGWWKKAMDLKFMEYIEVVNNFNSRIETRKNPNYDENLYNLWFKSDSQPLAMYKPGEEENGYYVKLFIEDLSNSGEGKKSQLHYSGKFYTGASMICFAANHNINNAIRGLKLKGLYGEEIGQYKKSPFGTISPAINSQDGWQIFAGTPNETDPYNWLYEAFLKVVNSPDLIKYEKSGLDIYASELNMEIPIMDDNIADALEKVRVTTRRVAWCIGDLEKIFPYTYEGERRFANIQLTRQKIHKVEFKKDNDGGYIVGKDGKRKYDIVFVKDNPVGEITEEQYQREYRMKFDAADLKIFDFKENITVIPQDKFTPENYYSIAGFDYGLQETKQMLDLSHLSKKSGSVSVAVKIACIPLLQFPNQFQYVAYEEVLVANPTPENIAEVWYSLLSEGIPIVADSIMWTRRSAGNSRSNSYSEIIDSSPLLRNDRRADTNRGIFKSYKRDWPEKQVSFNNYFLETEYRPLNSDTGYKYQHPFDNKVPGRKIFITDNCVNLINFFKSARLKINAQNQIEPAKIRDDFYDSFTYPIELIEMRKDTYLPLIRSYWDKYESYNPNPQISPMQNYVINNMFSKNTGRKVRGNF